jgi:hypothetical protein
MKKNETFYPCLVLFLCIVSTACSTLGRSVGAGAGIGGAVGAATGAIADPGEDGQNRARNILIGTAIGGAVGAGVGYIAGRESQDRDEDSYQRGKKEVIKEINERPQYSEASQPKLLPARTEARWVPDAVRGSTFVPGHFEYVIMESAKWDTSR